MNAENPVQINLSGVSATRTKDTRLAEQIGGSWAALVPRSVMWRRAAWLEPSQAEMQQPAYALSGSSGDIGGDDVDGVAVEGGPGPVVSHRGPRVSVRSGFLDIS